MSVHCVERVREGKIDFTVFFHKKSFNEYFYVNLYSQLISKKKKCRSYTLIIGREVAIFVGSLS